jgi:hypothetical protein
MRVAVIVDPSVSCAVDGPGRQDLRGDPQALSRVEPARQYPALRAFLAHVNAADSPFSTFGCKIWSAVEAGASQGHVFASRVGIVFLREADNYAQKPLGSAAHRLAELLQRESEFLWAELLISPAMFPEERAGYCLQLSLYARGGTPSQAEVRWGLGMAHTQQALLFVARELLRE